MIVVMVIFVLTSIVAGFIYSMKVEIRLARNDNNEAQLEWAARGAVEWAKYAVTHKCPGAQGYDALGEGWAGGSACIDQDPLYSLGIDLKNIPFGDGCHAEVTITDMERKWNINALANPQQPGPQPEVINNILEVMGVADHSEAQNITDCIIDWISPSERPTTHNGVKNDYYLRLDPPYYCKNGFMDDVSEFMRIKGITPDMVSATNPPSGYAASRSPFSRDAAPPSYDYHFDEVFTTMGAKINANTAPVHILMMVPGIDEQIAQNIVKARAGEDGVEGTDDDMPFRNASEVMARGFTGGMMGAGGGGSVFQPAGPIRAPQNNGGRNVGGAAGVNPAMGQMAQRYLDVFSQYFEVKINAQAGDYKRTYYAVIYRPRGRDAQTIRFYSD